MKKTEFKTVRDNKYFWLYYISTAFLNAYDEETEVRTCSHRKNMI